jgi:integrase
MPNYIKPTWPRIRRHKVGNMRYWIVDGRPKLRVEYLHTQEEAERRRMEMRAELANSTTDFSLSITERIHLIEAKKALEPYGVTLRDVVQEWISARKKKDRVSRVTVADALRDWLTTRKGDMDRGDLSWRTEAELRSMANYLRPIWGTRQVSAVTTPELVKWFDGLDKSAQTRANIRTKFSQFFNWCRVRGYVEANPLEHFKISNRQEAEVSILTVREAETLLKAARARGFAPYVILGMFAGLRPGEAQQMTWADIEPHQITVRRATSKRRESRFVPVDQPLSAALEALRPKEGGPITDPENWRKEWDTCKAAAGWGTATKELPDLKPWPADVLRHTFASYWLPIHADRPRLAEILGNSVEVIKKHYRRAIPRPEAERFWQLLNEK